MQQKMRARGMRVDASWVAACAAAGASSERDVYAQYLM